MSDRQGWESIQAFMVDIRRASVLARSLAPSVAAALFLFVVTLISIRRVGGFPGTAGVEALLRGIGKVIGETGWAAIKVWSFLALTVGISAGLLLQIDPELDLSDAILGGAGCFWFICYGLGLLLGPIGLLRPITIWILIAAGGVWLWRSPPRYSPSSLTTGQTLALLAIALVAVGMLPLQLGSPVPPIEDALCYVASSQRIVTFQQYLPFDNDPYGATPRFVQMPAIELLVAVIAIATRCKLAALAQSASMLPMTALIIFATWRLGKALIGDLAGGFSALLLFLTVIFRETTGLRGSAVDFALVALALAFIFDRKRSRMLVAIGAVVAGTAIATHTLDGALALAVIGGGSLLWIADGESRRFATAAVCMAGALLIAGPDLAIGSGYRFPLPTLPIMVVAGAAIIVFAATRLSWSEVAERRTNPWIGRALLMVLIAAMCVTYVVLHHSLIAQLLGERPVLVTLAVVGLISMAAGAGIESNRDGARLIAIALLIGVIGHYAGGLAWGSGNSLFSHQMGWEFALKIFHYWIPYFMVFPAAAPFVLLYRYMSPSLAIASLLGVIIYPFGKATTLTRLEYERSALENWALDFHSATKGSYWQQADNSRWVSGRAGRDLDAFLIAEKEAGRITPSTHVLQITLSMSNRSRFDRFAVFTGINSDPLVLKIQPQDVLNFIGSRVRQMNRLRQVIEQNPPYVLLDVPARFQKRNPWARDPARRRYDEVFDEGDLVLFRRKDLAGETVTQNRD